MNSVKTELIKLIKQQRMTEDSARKAFVLYRETLKDDPHCTLEEILKEPLILDEWDSLD